MKREQRCGRGENGLDHASSELLNVAGCTVAGRRCVIVVDPHRRFSWIHARFDFVHTQDNSRLVVWDDIRSKHRR